MLGFHSLDARESNILPWLFAQAGHDPTVFQRLMQVEAERVRELLSKRGIPYENLKSALRPTDRGKQVVLLYDWRGDTSANYAVAFGEHYFPLLRPELRTSLLHGDLHDIGHRGFPVSEFQRQHVSRRHGAIEDSSLMAPMSWSTLYAVYFSNLNVQDIQSLHDSLSYVPRYRGYVDITFSSPIRDYLAGTLTHEMVIYNRKAILSHGADEPLISNEDPLNFGLEGHGYEVVSLIDTYFNAFFSYKIEDSTAPGAEQDRILNLAALTGHVINVAEVEIIVPPDKLRKYLLVNDDKLRLMTSVGLHDVGPSELGSIIRTKLTQSYIYDLRYAQDGTPTFAVTAEFVRPDGAPARRLIALKYDEDQAAICLVSMY